MEAGVPLVILAVALLFMGLGALIDDRRSRYRRQLDVVGEPVEAVIPLLHSINDDRCIGCEACIDVCPTKVLELVDHKVRVVRFTDCVQCEQCATSCPTMALVMYRQGSTPRMLTVPELDENFQTGVPGQYLIGEIAGKPLVKNAANLGRAVIEHIAIQIRAQPAIGTANVLDVVVVGSGPGGLSAGLTCIKQKLSCVVLEKEHVISSTVSRYPKGKHFMAEPCTAQNVSHLPVFDSSKEELVAAWQRVVEGVSLPIKLGEAVESIKRGDDGIFEVKTTVATYRSRTVVLATGLRGKPRLLAVPGANLEKVQSLLDDPAEFAGEHVLVVGGGDSALEGAMSLADVGATVTLSYRGDGFKRCKQGNQRRLAEMTASQQLTVLLESNVASFTETETTIKLKDGTITTLPNRRAFVLIGADTPVAWLEANNVRFVERPHLYALGSTEDVVRRVVPDAVECPRTPEEAVAIVLGHEVHASSGRKVLSVIEHLRGEFHDVVTQVSGAFRLVDLEHRPRGDVSRATPTAGHRKHPNGRATPTVGHRMLPSEIQASRSTNSNRAIPSNQFGEERTVSANRFAEGERTVTANRFPDERSSISLLPIRPRSPKHDRGGGFDTGPVTAANPGKKVSAAPRPATKVGPAPVAPPKFGFDTGSSTSIDAEPFPMSPPTNDTQPQARIDESTQIDAQPYVAPPPPPKIPARRPPPPPPPGAEREEFADDESATAVAGRRTVR